LSLFPSSVGDNGENDGGIWAEGFDVVETGPAR
jgi:hypothetical protein